MPTARDILNVARSLIGVHETPDGSNIAHPITDWAAQYGYSTGDAWCSWKVSYEFYHVEGGASLIYNHPSGYSGDFRAMGKQHGLMVPGPVPGAIDVMDVDGKPDFTDHVGIVESVNADGSWVNIEGNHQNQVMRVRRVPGGGSHWFVLPKYSEGSQPVPAKQEEDDMQYRQYENVNKAVWIDCYRDKANYWVTTDTEKRATREIEFVIEGKDGSFHPVATDGQKQEMGIQHDHPISDILKQPRFKGLKGSFKLTVKSADPIDISIREVPKG